MTYTYYDEGMEFSGGMNYDSDSRRLSLVDDPDICYE
jgi:hypothetical protein